MICIFGDICDAIFNVLQIYDFPRNYSMVYLYMCITYIYLHLYTYIYIYIYIYNYIYICMYACIHKSAHTYMYIMYVNIISAHNNMHTFTHLHTHTYACKHTGDLRRSRICCCCILRLSKSATLRCCFTFSPSSSRRCICNSPCTAESLSCNCLLFLRSPFARKVAVFSRSALWLLVRAIR